MFSSPPRGPVLTHVGPGRPQVWLFCLATPVCQHGPWPSHWPHAPRTQGSHMRRRRSSASGSSSPGLYTAVPSSLTLILDFTSLPHMAKIRASPPVKDFAMAIALKLPVSCCSQTRCRLMASTRSLATQNRWLVSPHGPAITIGRSSPIVQRSGMEIGGSQGSQLVCHSSRKDEGQEAGNGEAMMSNAVSVGIVVLWLCLGGESGNLVYPYRYRYNSIVQASMPDGTSVAHL